MAEPDSRSGPYSTKNKGNNGENIAVKYLRSIGYRIVTTNFRAGRLGEIDVVCYDGNQLVFIEVKTRYTRDYGTPEDAVTYRKQARIRNIARVCLYVNKLWEVNCRFDVIAVDYTQEQRMIRHWRHAF